MGDKKFVCNARFVGRRSVDGPLNDSRLSQVVSELQEEAAKRKGQDELRCNLEFSDKNLMVTFIKKDEGFESDSESSKSVEADSNDKSMSGMEVKIIKDHVFRYNESDASSHNSGGSDSETSDHNNSTSVTSSSASSPTAELHKYKFDHLDTYAISDVLICHTDKVFKHCVIWVIRRSGSLEAMVFECVTEDNARQLYRKFHEVSKRSKLERHRRRKSDGGSVVTRGADYSGERAKRDKSEKGNITINNIDTSVIEKVVEKNRQKWNLVQHTDRNGVTHIEVESAKPGSLVSHMEPEPRSLISFSTPDVGGSSHHGPRSHGRSAGKKSNFAKELESILSGEIKRKEEHKEHKGRESGHQKSKYGESQSLRQRAPAMLLRKLDQFEEKAQKIWAKAEAEEENRKVWSKGSHSVIGISSPPRALGPQLDSSPSSLVVDGADKPGYHHKKAQEKEGRAGRPAEPGSSGGPSRGKFTSDAIKCKEKDGKMEENGRILIPTKTGKEPVKKLYPKESPLVYGGRFLPLGVTSPLQMTSQPHSLPIYPVQVAPVTWGRYPSELGPLHTSVDGPGRSRSRDRSRVSSDHRRRAQSKSPARRPPGGKYMDGVGITPPDMSGISRIFRDFGGAFMSKMSRKSDQKTLTVVGETSDTANLKSNLKKNKNCPVDVNENSASNSERVSSVSDNKKVHFNKFATVQMMQ